MPISLMRRCGIHLSNRDIMKYTCRINQEKHHFWGGGGHEKRLLFTIRCKSTNSHTASDTIRHTNNNSTVNADGRVRHTGGNGSLPRVRVLGEGRQAAGVHVSPDVDVHRGVRLGQLSRQGDPLGGQRRDRGPGQGQP